MLEQYVINSEDVIKNIRLSNQSLNDKVNELTELNEQLNSKNQSLSRNNNNTLVEYQEKINSLQNNLQENKINMDKMTEDNNLLQKQINQLAEINKKINRSLIDYTKQAEEELERNNETHQKQIQNMKAEYLNAANVSSEAYEQLNRELENLKKKKEHELFNLRCENEQNKIYLNECWEEKNNLASKLIGTNNEKEIIVKDATNVIKAKDSKLKEKERELEAALSNNDALGDLGDSVDNKRRRKIPKASKTKILADYVTESPPTQSPLRRSSRNKKQTTRLRFD